MTKAAIFYQNSASDTSCSQKIEVMFNPANYTVSRSVSYSGSNRDKDKKKENQTTYTDYPNMSFLGGSLDSLNLELIINKYEFKHYSGQEKKSSKELSIRDNVKEIEQLTLIKADIHKPPLCKFVWSDFSFKGYVTSLQVNYTMFLDDGTPVRAKINLTMQGCILGNDAKIPFESPDRTKKRTLNENQQLWEIAEDEYNDASKWREIADANNISNPKYLKSGTQLVVPALK